ncbi:MAG: alpha/beta hydrolase [Myxococcales bacterium]|jgi:acetyl esterase/lipase
MVMGKRPDVPTASGPVTAFAVSGLAAQLANAMASIPFRKPWAGGSNRLENFGVTLTRQVVRSFLGYTMSLSTPEFRSLEIVIDDLCRAILTPLLEPLDVVSVQREIAGVPGLSCRPRRRRPQGQVLYLHGGGYIGTSPAMYLLFTGWLARETQCDVFVPDYRLAPEFPFPASLLDAIAVYEGLLHEGHSPDRLFLAGDSGGGGLVTTLMLDARADHLPDPARLLLFSPEVSLTLDEPSVTANASSDVLPWNIPVQPYLHGIDSRDRRVSVLNADVSNFPPTFLAYGGQEIFRDAIREFADRLQQGGVETTVIEDPNMFHVFPILMPWAEPSRRVYRAVRELVRDQLERAAPAAALDEAHVIPDA